MSKYKCSKCGKILERDSKKYWIKSWCDTIDGFTRIIRVVKIKKK